MSLARRLAYHEMMGRLGIGDLHPGGSQASQLLLAELARNGTKRVLEVGAGIGVTTARLRNAGFEVTPLEPNLILRGLLKKRLGIDARPVSFQSFDDRDGAYDALIGESVFYALDLPDCFAKAHRLIRPGGLFAFSEMLWTEVANADVVRFVHDQTKDTFGIAMAPRTPITWRVWRKLLLEIGFREVVDHRLDGKSDGQSDRGLVPNGAHRDAERTARNITAAFALLRQPWMLPQYVAYRTYGSLSFAPPTWLESRVAVWRRD